MHTHFGDIASLLGRPKIASQVRTPAARRIEPVLAPPAPAQRKPAPRVYPGLALCAANFAANWQTLGFAEAYAAAVGRWGHLVSRDADATSAAGAAAEVLAVQRKIHRLRKDEKLPTDPTARAVILAAQRARGEI
jgi:hypothetical protein